VDTCFWVWGCGNIHCVFWMRIYSVLWQSEWQQHALVFNYFIVDTR
jgi:hypothetical protein